MWQPDGWGWRTRIGVLAAHLDIGTEAEFQAMAQAMAPAGVSLHSARVPLGVIGPDGVVVSRMSAESVRAFAEPPLVDNAAGLLAAAPLNAVVYAFTGSSYLLGVEGDKALKSRLQKRTRGIPVVIPCLAALAALRAVGARRVALIEPHWSPAEFAQLGAEYFRSQQFEVVYAALAELPSRQADVQPGPLYDWVKTHVPAEAEAVFIGGNAFRAVGVIQALEEALQRPVLTANQVAFWQALRLANVNFPLKGYGQLFSKPLPAI